MSSSFIQLSLLTLMLQYFAVYKDFVFVLSDWDEYHFTGLIMDYESGSILIITPTNNERN